MIFGGGLLSGDLNVAGTSIPIVKLWYALVIIVIIALIITLYILYTGDDKAKHTQSIMIIGVVVGVFAGSLLQHMVDMKRAKGLSMA